MLRKLAGLLLIAGIMLTLYKILEYPRTDDLMNWIESLVGAGALLYGIDRLLTYPREDRWKVAGKAFLEMAPVMLALLAIISLPFPWDWIVAIVIVGILWLRDRRAKNATATP